MSKKICKKSFQMEKYPLDPVSIEAAFCLTMLNDLLDLKSSQVSLAKQTCS